MNSTVFSTQLSPYSLITHNYFLLEELTFLVSPSLIILTRNRTSLLHITKSASSRLGVLYRLQHFLSPQQMLTIYKGLVRPCLEYASHICGGSTHTALLDRVESNDFRLIGSPPLTDCLLNLKSRRTVASLSIFYRYFHAHSSSELTDCMPPPLLRPRRIRLSTFAHPYSIQTPYARVNQYLHSFILFGGQLWNLLPLSVFPPSYNLQYFKREVSRHLAL